MNTVEISAHKQGAMIHRQEEGKERGVEGSPLTRSRGGIHIHQGDRHTLENSIHTKDPPLPIKLERDRTSD
jgi:hypothetical protein